MENDIEKIRKQKIGQCYSCTQFFTGCPHPKQKRDHPYDGCRENWKSYYPLPDFKCQKCGADYWAEDFVCPNCGETAPKVT